MFRRRTDQVYATLQQVQRRITEQSGSGTPNLEAKPSSPQPFSPLQDALPRTQLKPLVAHQPEPPSLPSQMLAPQRRFVVPLSGQLAVTLIVLWIASCALCFVLGQHDRDRRAPGAAAASEGFASGDAGNRDVPTDAAPTKPLGSDLLVLNQVLDVTPEQERKFDEQAQQLNDIMLKNPQKGWKPWFGVRKPTNGGLQLVFGEVAEGQFGIVKKDFEEFGRMMAQPPPKGGGYGKATWLKVN
jgi:hypothetical protein